MIVKIDEEVIFEIDDLMLKLLADDLEDPISEIKRRLRWVIEHKCDQCFKRLEQKWMPVLREDPFVDSIPKSKSKFCDLVFSHRNYVCKSERIRAIGVK